MADFESVQRGLRQRNARIALLLQSGEAEHVEQARQLIDLYEHHALELTTLGLVDRAKIWLTQPRDRLDAKSRCFLLDLWEDAKNARGRARGNWRIVGRCAHVALLAGRIGKARRWFGKALSDIGDISRLPNADDRALAWNMVAARAELRIYMGDPKTAEQDITSIPDPMAWHLWVRAFALHMLGFAERVPFGGPPGNPPHKPGAEDRYLESNRQIDDVLAIADQDRKLPDQDRYDIELLRAANWGAISRRRLLDGAPDDGAQANAAAALTDFKSAPGMTSSNLAWSWRKERRGRLLKVYRGFDSGRRFDVETWREAYRDCYMENLLQAGLPSNARPGIPLDQRDGEIDQEDDHGEDDDRA